MQGRTQNHWNHCLINFTILIVGNILVVGFGKIELFIFYKRIYQFFNRFTSMRFLQCALHSELSYSTKWVPLQKEKAKKAAITPLNAAAVKSNLYKISIARNFHKTVDVSLFFSRNIRIKKGAFLAAIFLRNFFVHHFCPFDV